MINSLRRKAKRSLYILRHDGPHKLLSTIWQKIQSDEKDWRQLYDKMLSLPTTKERFSAIYERNLWGGDDSLSGDGSSFIATKNLRQFLPVIIEKYGIKSILDAPCGDFAWMNKVVSGSKLSYTGCDIVDKLIARNNYRFSSENVRFLVKDITRDPLPQSDMIIVRDCLFHLSFEDIDKFLDNISNIEYKYLLTTNHIGFDSKSKNVDIKTGDFRPIYLFNKPFCFDDAAVLERVADFCEGQLEREMVLLPKPSVPRSCRDGS